MNIPSDQILIPPEEEIAIEPQQFQDMAMAEQPMEAMPMAEIEAISNMAQTDPSLLTEEEMDMVYNESPEVEMMEDINEDHYRNLAAEMPESKLRSIAQELILLVEDDDESRKDWYDRVKKGIRNLGVSSKIEGGANFDGASTVVHPVLMESCTQFQARAIQEMWPSGGPVKTRVLGKSTPEKQDQAQRVQDYMNYLYTIEMPEAFTQEDNMLFRLPISGSAFKKMFYDPLKDRLSSIFVEPSDFIVSYQTTDLQDSPRFAHRIREYKNDTKKKEASGFYVNNQSSNSDPSYNEIDKKPDIIDEIDATEGKTYNTAINNDDDRVTLYEVYVDHDCEITDDKGKALENSDGILSPYIITIDRDQQTVKRIQRNWRPDDKRKTKRMYFTHYKFTPGLGFYGYGFLHLIGDMATTATGTLRSLLDAAAFSNMQGGFKTRDSRIPHRTKPISPGEWVEVNSSYDDLRKTFFPLPYKEPSGVLFQLLGYVDEKARHLAGITEVNTGEQNAKDSPVGTTAMLLEQGTKVFTSIHKRIHEAHKYEFKIMAELIEENMPDEGYPYLFGTEEGTVLPQDFDKRVDVIPISDPNISTNTQRVAKAQSVLELQQQYPNVIPEREAVKRMLEAIQIPDIEGLIGNKEDWDRQDQEAAQKQQEQEALEKQRVEIETSKLQSEADNARSQSTANNLEAMMNAFDAAALAATNVELVDAADGLMKSAGFTDFNEPGLIPSQQLDSMGVYNSMLDAPVEQQMIPQEQQMIPQEQQMIPQEQIVQEIQDANSTT